MLCRYYYKEDVRQTDRFAPIWRTRLTRFDTNRTQLLRSTTTHARCFRIWTRLVSENNKTRLPERVNLTASVLGRNGSMPISTLVGTGLCQFLPLVFLVIQSSTFLAAHQTRRFGELPSLRIAAASVVPVLLLPGFDSLLPLYPRIYRNFKSKSWIINWIIERATQKSRQCCNDTEEKTAWAPWIPT